MEVERSRCSIIGSGATRPSAIDLRLSLRLGQLSRNAVSTKSGEDQGAAQVIDLGATVKGSARGSTSDGFQSVPESANPDYPSTHEGPLSFSKSE